MRPDFKTLFNNPGTFYGDDENGEFTPISEEMLIENLEKAVPVFVYNGEEEFPVTTRICHETYVQAFMGELFKWVFTQKKSNAQSLLTETFQTIGDFIGHLESTGGIYEEPFVILFFETEKGKISLMFLKSSELTSRRFQKKLRRVTLSHGKMDRVKWGRAVVLGVEQPAPNEVRVEHRLLNTEIVQEFVDLCHGGGAQ